MDESISFRPTASPSRGPNNVADFIQRVNTQLPGGFRMLKQEDIKSRPKVEAVEPVEADEGGVTDHSSDAEEKHMLQMRDEMLGGVIQARQAAHLALEFVSLVLSKDTPSVVQGTISEETRININLGTLAVSMLHAPTALTRIRVPDNKLTAMGKRLMDVNKAADSALAAAKRLRDEIATEIKYWTGTLAVSESGWSTFRHPREAHHMAVKLAISNLSPELKSNSVAPLRKSQDGSVQLDYGKMGEESKRLQVSIIRSGDVVGRSSLPQPLPYNAPFQDRVKEARDNFFARELWHELNRESRSLASLNVRPENSLADAAILYTGDRERTISMRLVTIDGDGHGDGPIGPDSDDATAEAINIALHLLLSSAHRVKERKRSEQAASKTHKVRPPYPLLLPVVTFLQHEQDLSRCIRFFGTMTKLLRSAGMPASCAISEAPITIRRHAPPSDLLIAGLLRPSEVQFDLVFTPESRLRILARPVPYFTTGFFVYLLPTADGGSNPLTATYPPATRVDRRPGMMQTPAADGFYHDPAELFLYLHGAVPRALLQHFRLWLREMETGSTTWMAQFSGKALTDEGTGRFGLRFDVPCREDGQLELVVDSVCLADGEPVARTWKWTAEGACQEEGELDSLVRRVLSH